MKRYLAIALCMASLWASNAEAKTLDNLDEVRALTQRSMDHVLAGRVDELFTVMLPYWPLPENEFSMLRMQTMTQRNVVGERFGATVGIALVYEQIIADSIVRITYIEKFERHIIRWVFTFYKPKDQWLVNSLVWDDDIDALF